MKAMKRRVLLGFTVACLSGCIVLPFGVHVNRPMTTGGWGNARVGLGIAQAPLGQGTVAAVTDDAGNEANPVPLGAGTGRNTALAGDLALGLMPDLDVGLGARGLYALLEPFRAGPWSLSFSPAVGVSNAETDSLGTRAKVEKGKLTNVNATALGCWRLDPAADTFFAYAGAGYNALFSDISVTEAGPKYAAAATGSAGAPTILGGGGGR